MDQVQRKADIGKEVQNPVIPESVPGDIARPEQYEGVCVVLYQRPEILLLIERANCDEQTEHDDPVTKRRACIEFVIEHVVEQAAEEHEAHELHIRDQIRKE